MSIKYVIFDVGGVCYPYSLDCLDEWALKKSRKKEVLIAKGGVKGFDYNPYMMGEVDFSGFCMELCKYAGIEYEKGIEISINEKLHEGVGDFYEETLEVMNKLKKRGIKIGLLSNALECLEDSASCLTVEELIFVSYKLHCLKPERDIYQKVIDKLGCKAEEVIFIDDKEKNVSIARSLGMIGIVFDKKTIKNKVLAIVDEKNITINKFER